MKAGRQKDIFEILPQAIEKIGKNIIDPFFKSPFPDDQEGSEPLRAEIYTEEQLKHHAGLLAARHIVVPRSPSEQLLRRLAENESILLHVHSLLTDSVKKNNRIAPAAEWLLDNFYLIEEQVYTAKQHLPKGYSKGLPQLAKGESAGLPRVYDIAVELISHSDGHINLHSLVSFVNTYQETHYLKLGELWAIPIMLRLALLENLRRLSIQISTDITNKSLAESWAVQFIEVAEKDPKNLILVIADMARSNPPIASSFVAELTRRLQEQGGSLTLATSWLEQMLQENGFTSAELIQQENQKQAADQVSISNSISSLRFLGNTDWREFVELTSIVEQTLDQDISGIYPLMDFHTRDDYRHVVEKIAKDSLLSEQVVAGIAIQLSHEDTSEDIKRKHVGYYLKGRGVKLTAHRAGMKRNYADKIRGIVKKIPFLVYAGTILILTALLSWGLISIVSPYRYGITFVLMALVFVIASSQFAVSFANWLISYITQPSLLARMDFSKGIPDEYRAMVVVPTLLSSVEGVDDLVEAMEVRFLANRDANIFFALLTDFKDAASETLPEDEKLVQYAKDKIIALNKKYERDDVDSFFIFHRPRTWNPKEKIWMGYERKRGKLADLNALLCGEENQYFSLLPNPARLADNIRYIITLDTDTQLPRDSAWKMIATMAHPLNQPVYSEKKKRVVDGYTILQPRVSNSLPVTRSSIYMKAHGNEPGTDPYTKATSDVYQDIFGEGSFIGKGIYDISSFEKVLKDRFPENRILSHDLLEGSYARSGLITDVQLYEEYPSGYLIDMARRHRWVRGDWQIGQWVMPMVPGMDHRLHKNPLSLLSKWKIADNLRRSFVPLAFTGMLLYGWLISGYPLFWTFMVMALIVGPTIISLVVQLLRKPGDTTFAPHFFYTTRSFKDTISRQALDFIFLPYEALIYLDAFLRTMWRIYITRKNLLQWNPYRQRRSGDTIGNTYAKMWLVPFLAIVIGVYLSIYSPWVVSKVGVFLLLWMMSPLVAWYISKPTEEKKSSISEEKTDYLRQLARKIYFFFETFVTREDNWLPPDNYQEQPVERTAHRTSPTNIGLSLLANLTAYDFGYITVSRLSQLTGNTLGTIERMEKYRGHLYNWYDTISLVPLHPRYISTVDSGNMVGHLVTLQQGLIGIGDQKIITASIFDGLLDEIRLQQKEATLPGLDDLAKDIEKEYPQHIDELRSTSDYLDEIEQKLHAIEQENATTSQDIAWLHKAMLHIREIKAEMRIFFPWLSMPDVPEAFRELLKPLTAIPSLQQISDFRQNQLQKITRLYERENSPEENEWLNNFRTHIIHAGRQADEMLFTLQALAAKCHRLSQIEYDFLFDQTQNLLAIGYNVEEHRRDNSFYDLLASEARLTTFIAIAQGRLPQQSWFSLGRQLTNTGNTPILLSWSGSMFEYLMPVLVMPSYENTLLYQTCRAVIQKQIDYGRKQGVPWGISESGYNMLDAQMNYQYRAFGVPGLGFKRGLGEDLVISPYSTIMSLMVLPKESIENLETMRGEGFEGRYGFFEAIDYTRARLLRKQQYTIIQSFMAHHQGMSLLSIGHLLHDQPMQRRFETDVQVKSALLLLQERIPRVTTFYSPSVHEADTSITLKDNGSIRVLDTADTTTPEVQLLSNGRYNVMVTNGGGGYSHWKNIALTRWREDVTCDNWGTFCFIRDLDTNKSWSTSFQPTLQKADSYEAVFSQGRAEFRRRDQLIEMHTEIVVSPEDDIELRRIHLTNRSRKRRTIEITSYSEVVMNTAIADELHPAFSNLFVQTQINEHRNAILCTRRPRAENEHNPWMFHLMKVHDADITGVSYETDRDVFIGRGQSIHHPKVMNQAEPLSGSQGSVLDPIVSIQYRIVLEPYQTVTVDMIYGIAETIEGCNGLIEKYQDRHLINRVLELAWVHSQVILRQINATEPDAQLYSRLASSIIFTNASMRADPSIILKNQKGQQSLWTYAVSGDLPIVLVQIEDSANINLVRQMIQAHTYWRLKGLMVDLVIWNDDHGGYRQDLQNQIIGSISPGNANDLRDKPGGIFIRSADQIPNEDRILFQSVAHIVISDKWGTLEEQMNSRTKFRSAAPYFTPVKIPAIAETTIKPPTDLQFFNGYGGYAADGKEYVIITNANKNTPAPWINVIANPGFGFIVTESGQSYTWMENAHAYRLTPWNNDPVTDLKGEAFYVRDEESGHFWSPTPLPCPGKTSYVTRHGFGYSLFQHSEDGIETEMCMYADINAPVKFMVLKVRNRSERRRRLSVTGYVEWVLGDIRTKSGKHIITEMDIKSGAILAGNRYHMEMGSRVAFFDVDDPNRSYTADRTEFIGRHGTMASPDAMMRKRLSGKSGPALDPCGALQVAFDLAEDEEHQVVFRLGAGKNRDEALQLIQSFEGSMASRKALDKAKQYWTDALNAVQIETPDQAVNLLANGWLNYQALVCRFWGRSGFYQSGGAFGFRDQLQDVLSLLHTNPMLARQQLLLCASRQFKEGDVQHWWHPPAGRGVRTTCSDDYLWLPYVASRYIITTGDTGILEETSYFLEGRLLNAHEESYYDLPLQSDQRASFYEHCVKAIERGLQFGAHGLPLMGSGDWNDGMDKVGHNGKGESVWLAFFLYDILNRFVEVATIKGDSNFVIVCRQQAEQLKNNIQQHAWDGEWYRRAYFDNGSPLGSKVNDECKIDSIAQSWSVLSKAGDPERTAKALQSASEYLVRAEGQYIQLFDPPFDKSAMNPGYIKGYVPGVRENGGQYTHAAVWLVMAFAAVKDKKKTWELLQMINPINHGSNQAQVELYKTEPYVIAADIYGGEEHKGRGGWTWYTGSAGWMYQLVLEWFIGLQRVGNQLSFTPCFPDDWPSVKISYRYFDSVYHIEIKPGDQPLLLNGQPVDGRAIELRNDASVNNVVYFFNNQHS